MSSAYVTAGATFHASRNGIPYIPMDAPVHPGARAGALNEKEALYRKMERNNFKTEAELVEAQKDYNGFVRYQLASGVEVDPWMNDKNPDGTPRQHDGGPIDYFVRLDAAAAAALGVEEGSLQRADSRYEPITLPNAVTDGAVATGETTGLGTTGGNQPGQNTTPAPSTSPGQQPTLPTANGRTCVFFLNGTNTPPPAWARQFKAHSSGFGPGKTAVLELTPPTDFEGDCKLNVSGPAVGKTGELTLRALVDGKDAMPPWGRGQLNDLGTVTFHVGPNPPNAAGSYAFVNADRRPMRFEFGTDTAAEVTSELITG